MGDRSYRKYFTLFTFITSAASIAWLSADEKSFWNVPIPSISTSGYISIRWYQQNSHGIKPLISLK